MPASDERTGERPAPRSGERIAKLLARAGVASRREVERMIAEGRVKIGEDVVTTPATVLANLRGVTVDGKPVKAAEAARLFAFHKPAGLITAERDPAGRPTIYTALRNALPRGTPRLMPIGRLDLNTEGLLLLTTDGELKRAMELPSSGIPRTYRARTFGEVTQTQLEELIEGVTIEGMHYGPIDANMERRTGRNQWIELTLTEGKNREVRRVLEHLGLQVSRLLRTSYGPFVLGELPRGAAAEIRQVDVERFRKMLVGSAGGAQLSIPPPRTLAPVAKRPEAAPSSKAPASKPRRKPAGHPPPRDDRPPRPGNGRRSSHSDNRRSPSPGGRRKS
jgi:23S rRNA pseudouridine2605 synthase